MQRTLIAECTGAGADADADADRTMLAKALSARPGLPHHELDALRPRCELGAAAVVRGRVRRDRPLVTDQHHTFLADSSWRRADMVTWLDLRAAR